LIWKDAEMHDVVGHREDPFMFGGILTKGGNQKQNEGNMTDERGGGKEKRNENTILRIRVAHSSMAVRGGRDAGREAVARVRPVT